MDIRYRKRIIEEKIKEKLAYSGAIVIEGPKWCGKSTTAKIFAKKIVSLQSPDVLSHYKQLTYISREMVLYGEKPLLFDEWQTLPSLWDFIRTDVDETNEKGNYILTGSVSSGYVDTMHSGFGRINNVVMRPMSFYESGESNGYVSLAKLFDKDYHIEPKEIEFTIQNLASKICYGGWPGLLDLEDKYKKLYPKDLVNNVLTQSRKDFNAKNYNILKLEKFLKSYARNISTIASDKTILDDIGESYSKQTITEYHEYLKRLFIIDDIMPWSPNIRSKSRLRQAVKRGLADPSIACALLGLDETSLLENFTTFGFLFESLVARDLKVYADSIDAKVYYYQDSSGLEVDFIIEKPDMSWGAVEVKLGLAEVEKASKSLKKLESIVEKKPSFLMILTNTKLAYKNNDGIYIIPIASLKN